MKRICSTLSTAALLVASLANPAQAAAMSVSSTSFTEGATIATRFADHGAACGDGQGVSPQVGWTNLPDGTRSVAVMLFDPDGGKGLGVAHWVAYNIDAARGQIRENEAATSIAGITIGKNMQGNAAYRGMCPPGGDTPHHFVLTVIATDLAPGALPAGLDRDALLSALKGHTLAGQTIGARYGH